MREIIATNHYLFVPNFISLEEARFLHTAFKEHASVNNLTGDTQVINSSSVYNFMPFVRLLIEKIPDVSRLLKDSVLPTYTYARIYKNGAVLERHRDRAACEISLTLNLFKDVDWPIYFQKPDGYEVGLELEPGDAVLYLGCVADHWRNVFVGDEYSQVFMHYVRSFGPNNWAFFDKHQVEQPAQASTPNLHNLNNLHTTPEQDWQVTVI